MSLKHSSTTTCLFQGHWSAFRKFVKCWLAWMCQDIFVYGIRPVEKNGCVPGSKPNREECVRPQSVATRAWTSYPYWWLTWLQYMHDKCVYVCGSCLLAFSWQPAVIALVPARLPRNWHLGNENARCWRGHLIVLERGEWASERVRGAWVREKGSRGCRGRAPGRTEESCWRAAITWGRVWPICSQASPLKNVPKRWRRVVGVG